MPIKKSLLSLCPGPSRIFLFARAPLSPAYHHEKQMQGAGKVQALTRRHAMQGLACMTETLMIAMEYLVMPMPSTQKFQALTCCGVVQGLARIPETLVIAVEFIVMPTPSTQQAALGDLQRTVYQLHPDLKVGTAVPPQGQSKWPLVMAMTSLSQIACMHTCSQVVWPRSFLFCGNPEADVKANQGAHC